jgi:phosphomevalonate kinase
MAVDRYAHCDLQAGGDGWTFSALGHRGPSETVSRERLLASEPPDRERVWSIAWKMLRTLDQPFISAGGAARIPAGGAARFDTSAFHDRRGAKLGLGSSAALCVAVYAGFSKLLGQHPSHAGAAEAHRRFQGGAGSGIDVAAAWYGGTLRFRRPAGAGCDPGEVVPWPLPAGITLSFVYTGVPARTADHLQRLSCWLEQGSGQELGALAAASASMFESGDLMAALERYVAALRTLDQAAELGIFSEPHRRLRQLAFDAGVVYKPCGAGGGDLGAAFTPDPEAADRFARLVADNGFLPLALETAPHGIEATG